MEKEGTGRGSCSASRSKRTQFLSNVEGRNGTLSEIKLLLKQVGDIELANKLSTLIYEIYLDAQYRERANLQLQ